MVDKNNIICRVKQVNNIASGSPIKKPLWDNTTTVYKTQKVSPIRGASSVLNQIK